MTKTWGLREESVGKHSTLMYHHMEGVRLQTVFWKYDGLLTIGNKNGQIWVLSKCMWWQLRPEKNFHRKEILYFLN